MKEVWASIHGKVDAGDSKILVGGIFGFSCGLLFVIDNQIKENRTGRIVLQGVVGSLTGVIITGILHLDLLSIFLAGVIGLLAGATTRIWISHLNLP
jgi:hypothetical protein